MLAIVEKNFLGKRKTYQMDTPYRFENELKKDFNMSVSGSAEFLEFNLDLKTKLDKDESIYRKIVEDYISTRKENTEFDPGFNNLESYKKFIVSDNVNNNSINLIKDKIESAYVAELLEQYLSLLRDDADNIKKLYGALQAKKNKEDYWEKETMHINIKDTSKKEKFGDTIDIAYYPSEIYGENDKLKLSIDNDSGGDLKFVIDNNSHNFDGKRNFVIPRKDSIYLFSPGSGGNHSDFPTGNENNERLIEAGGSLSFKNGKITEITNDSGHYKPNIKDCVYSLLVAVAKILPDGKNIKDVLDKDKINGDGEFNICHDHVENKIYSISLRTLDLIDKKEKERRSKLSIKP
ncbi:MAG: hypothetical protein LBB13_03570 [Rickettsiales bacterium]|jgi:hypothetical protein|nr:hypothetical protein [Rickettsiales bacterium]